MKNLLMLTLLVVSITSCSKDAFEPAHDGFFTIQKSEILVTVTRIDYSYDGCNHSCGNGSESVAYLTGADIKVFAGAVAEPSSALNTVVRGSTDSNGKWLGPDLEPGQYTVIVESPYGKKSRLLYTQLNKRSSIEFSF